MPGTISSLSCWKPTMSRLPLRHKRADRYARRSLKGSLRNRLGYAPAFPQLQEMIGRSVRWNSKSCAEHPRWPA